jgi:hypothetical protein
MVAAAMNPNTTPADAEPEHPFAGDDPVYAYKPNLVGAPWVFRLGRNGLDWEYGRRSGTVRYDQIKRVRMAFRPATMQGHRFITEIWSPQAPKLQISSTSFRGLMEQARQDGDYAAFVGELHRRLDAAGAAARFESGMHPVVYWPGAAIMAAIGGGLLFFLAKVIMNRDFTGALVVIGVMALFAWQVGTIFYRNRPRSYRPDDLPRAVMPKA